MRTLLIVVLTIVLPAVAQAAQLSLMLRTVSGRPIEDAVVTFKPAQDTGRAPIRQQGPYVMAQHNIAFEPHVLIVPVGADVAFPNRDKVRHHVYSFSAPKRFELKLYGREEARTQRFDKPGVVALGCNIHDRMSGYIVVVDTPYAAKSDAAGRAVLSGAPDGAGVLTVWQSELKAPGGAVSRSLRLAGDTQQTMTLDLRPALPTAGPSL